MIGGSQDGVWIGLPTLPPVIEFRFTHGDEVLIEAAGGEVTGYGVQYHYTGQSPDGAYGEHCHYYTHYPALPKEKHAKIVNTKNIGKRAAQPRKVDQPR